ncbi:hypothetical protein [Pseudokineococcus lusitanus]|uniref:Uncharacterized protein n=1 Tax=Pseudokineococcus lusitanus TaxID=763993 RepID=A0A3N1HTT2_9ACTN|nr:hypothetical protein [Pseudokineococcus lusitanus]ROP45921.1 hypothetical protein EDC03_0536 [Pseudokineococcus lusitanus]
MSAPTPRDLAAGRVRVPTGEGAWLADQVEDGPTAEDMAAATAPASDPPTAADAPPEDLAAAWGSHRWLREALAARDRAHGAALGGHQRVAEIHRFEAGLALAVDFVRGVHRAAAGVNRCATALNAIAVAIRPPVESPAAEEVPDARQP